MQVPSQCGHGMTCIHPVVVGEMHLYHHSIGGDTAGRFDLYFLPFRISHGDGRLWSTGVVLRHNIAK